MIHWLVQSTDVHPDLVQGVPPEGLLGPDESAHFATLRTDKRRQEWLLGRWTAKQLLRGVVQEQTGAELAPAAVQILNGYTRAPMIRCQVPGFTSSCWSLSISHSHRHAFCAVVDRSAWPLGADMEQVESRGADFVADYFTPAEQALVAQAPAELYDILVTAIWSAKEAALKALQLGLTVDTRSLTCQIEMPQTMPTDWTPFYIQWNGHLDNPSTPELSGWWRPLQNFVLTLVA